MHSMIFLLGLVFLVSAQRTVASQDDRTPTGEPIDPQVSITISLPEDEGTRDGSPSGEHIPHTIRVSGVVAGQRIQLPHAGDGRCRLDAVVGVDDVSSDKIEFDPDGRHWSQHDIQTMVTTSIDAATCEVVVVEAVARDHVRKKELKRASPRLLDKIRGDLPARPGPESLPQEPANGSN